MSVLFVYSGDPYFFFREAFLYPREVVEDIFVLYEDFGNF